MKLQIFHYYYQIRENGNKKFAFRLLSILGVRTAGRRHGRTQRIQPLRQQPPRDAYNGRYIGVCKLHYGRGSIGLSEPGWDEAV